MLMQEEPAFITIPIQTFKDILNEVQSLVAYVIYRKSPTIDVIDLWNENRPYAVDFSKNFQ